MTAKDWIAAAGILAALLGAGISYGQTAAKLDDALQEIELLRQDMRGINSHFIEWASTHREN